MNLTSDRPVCHATGQFTDFDSFAQSAEQWELRFSQLDRGKFNGGFSQIMGTGGVLSHARWNRKMEQTGGIPIGSRSFCLPVSKPGDLWWQSRRFDRETIGVTRYRDELTVFSPQQFTVFALCPTIELIEQAGELLEIKDPNHLLDETPFASATSGERRRLIATCRHIFNTHAAGGLSDGVFGDMFLNLTMELLILFRRDKHNRPRPNVRLRERGLKRALAIIHECPGAHLTVPYLSQQAGVSVRTLGYAFRDVCGLSPKAYLQTQKLNLAHKALLCAGSDGTRVRDIARAAGFSHLGQFAHDYRKQFRETPSFTLRNRHQINTVPKSADILELTRSHPAQRHQQSG